MAESATTYETAPQAHQWKCTACAELWDAFHLAENDKRCPECRGPLRLISSLPVGSDHPVERALVAVSHDQQWLVVHWPDFRKPWTVMERLEGVDGYGATGDTFADKGQQAGEILTTFLATQREGNPRILEHTAAD